MAKMVRSHAEPALRLTAISMHRVARASPKKCSRSWFSAACLTAQRVQRAASSFWCTFRICFNSVQNSFELRRAAVVP
jgi:hypothetical protein